MDVGRTAERRACHERRLRVDRVGATNGCILVDSCR